MNLAQLLRVLVIISLSFGLSSILSIKADNPSPAGWNLSGGGFCQGTYTVSNTTLTPNPGIYAENCSTGRNDCFSATDLGAVWSCILPNLSQGGLVHLRAGFFSLITTINFKGAQLNGAGSGIILEGSGASYTTNGTFIEAKTNGMTMIESSSSVASVTCNSSTCTGAPTLQYTSLRDFTLFANNLAAIGIDFRMTEESTGNRFTNIAFDSQVNIYGTGQTGWTGFTTCMYLDGNEDTILDKMAFYDSSNTGTDVHWQVPSGNIVIQNSFIGAGTIPSAPTINVVGAAQTWAISDSTLASMKIAGGTSSGTQLIYLNGDYIATPSGVARLNLNGQTVNVLKLDGDFVLLGTTNPMFSGTGTISTFSMSGCAIYFNGGAWNSGGATLTKQTTLGDNHVSAGAPPAGFPFTPDGNGNF